MIDYNFSGRYLIINGLEVNFEFSILEAFAFNNVLIVYLNPDDNLKKYGQFKNLFCVSKEGKILWNADLPTTDTDDCYTKVFEVNGNLFATSWSSYRCMIDVLSGKIKEKTFIK